MNLSARLLSLWLLIAMLPTMYGQKDYAEQSNYLLYQGAYANDQNLLNQQQKNASGPRQQARLKFRYFAHFAFRKMEPSYSKTLQELNELAKKTPEAKPYAHLAQSIYYDKLRLDDIGLEEAHKAEKAFHSQSPIDHYHLAKLYYLIYVYHTRTEDRPNAEKALHAGIRIAQSRGYHELLVNFYNGKASVFNYNKGGVAQRKAQDSSYYYLRQAEIIAKNYPKEITSSSKIITQLNLSDYFNTLRSESPSPVVRDSLVKHLSNALSINLPSSFIDLHAVARGQKALLLIEEGDLAGAGKLLLQNQTELEAEAPTAYYTMMQNAEALKNLYVKMGQPAKALQYADLQLKYFGLEYDQNVANKNKAVEAKFENATLQNRLLVAEEEQELKRTQIYLLGTLLAIISLLLYHNQRSSRQKLKIQSAEAERLDAERLAAELQLSLEKENRERMAAEQEILKLQKEQIERDHLIQTLRLEQKQKTLEKIEETIQETDAAKELQSLLKQDYFNDKNLDQDEPELKDLQPDFYDKLEHTVPKILTGRDKKICAYVYVGLSNKEIASILNVESKSVRMSKYRIKQKLQIDKEQDLLEYLKAVMA